jgi:hypothetical protein
VHRVVSLLMYGNRGDAAKELLALSTLEQTAALCVACDLVAWVHWRWASQLDYTDVERHDAWREFVLEVVSWRDGVS